MHRPIAAALMISLSVAPTVAMAQVANGALPSGARWTAEVPASWNGTLLLWSRGYSLNVGAPDAAPAQVKAELLKAGYALVGSDYGAAGWALKEAVPAQAATLDAFAARYGKPKRVIAWGNSMGGLVSTALAEQRAARIDGAASFCSSMGGAIGMMNMALDGAYAFRTLIAPGSDIRIVNIDDDMANAKRVGAALSSAMASPQGRARVALAGVLAGIPGWTKPGSAEPRAGDHEAQVEQIADAFVRGAYLPRVDQEKRAGGAFSWNKGIDYRRQLRLSGRGTMVEALYRKTGLSLEADLKTLNAGANITAKPSASAYMMQHYTPTARPAVPLLAVQAVGDGLTSPSLQQSYADAAKSRDVISLWVNQAGHCNFKPEVVVGAIGYLDERLDTGRWPTRPVLFVDHRPSPMLRPCFRGRRCR